MNADEHRWQGLKLLPYGRGRGMHIPVDKKASSSAKKTPLIPDIQLGAEMDDLEQRRACLVKAAPSRLAEIHSFLRRLGVDEASAQDIAQDTFLIAWQGASRLRGERHLKGWLYGIAYRRYLQHRDRERAQGTLELSEEMAQVASDPGSDERLSAQVTRDALRTLPGKYLHPLVLVYWQDLSYVEASKVLSLPVGTLAWRVHKALKMMRQALAEKGLNHDLARHRPASTGAVDPVCED